LGQTHIKPRECRPRRDPRGFAPTSQGNPRVTGVLPVALEDATKVVQALLLSGKEYVCVMRLHQRMPNNRVEAILEEFQGEIFQRPPLRASVKRRLRTRKIYYLDFLEMREKNVLFKVGCESGTYIRKLCFDVGEVLGCGAHMQELRRTRAGPFTEDEGLVTLYDILQREDRWQEDGDEAGLRQVIFPMEKALELLPKILIRDSAVAAVCHGANVAAPGVLSLETGINRGDGLVVFSQKNEAVAFVQALASSEDILSMSHGFVAKTIRVLMDRDIYPKMWSRSGGT
jgi:H/ACA ribonucleoprotein complex subunit 4